MISCTQLATSLARQTPVYDENFLKDFISDMPGIPFIGRHMTETWEDGADTRTFDKISVGQPDYTANWNKRVGAECGNTLPPRQFVAFGTTRDTYFMENKVLQSQTFSLDQLRTIPKLGKQMAEIYRNIRRQPTGFLGDYLRTRFTSYNDTLYVCGANFQETPITLNGNIDPNCNVIELGSAANLPTSDLNLTYLQYYQQVLGMRGYDIESGLTKGMRNLLCHSRTYQRLVGLNPEVRAQLHLVGVKDVSPLYMPGTGINADPFGPFAPTFDEQQLRFQDAGNGLLTRVLPYINQPATTGLKPVINPAWLNARYAITYVLHPKAATLFTPKPKKVHDMIPSVNTAMWGAWDFINPKGPIIWQNQDGTSCTVNNDLQWLFYWLCYLEYGFKYEQRPLVLPILHLIDGAGKACMVDNPICGAEPQYTQYSTSDSPAVCQV